MGSYMGLLGQLRTLDYVQYISSHYYFIFLRMIIVLCLYRRTPCSSDRHANYLGEKHHDLACFKCSDQKSIRVSGIYVYGEKEVNETEWDQPMNPGE